MNDCLFSKLSVSIDNPNLPIYNKAFVSVKQNSTYCFFIASSTGSVIIDTKVPFLPYGGQTKITHKEVQAGSTFFGTIYNADVTDDSDLIDMFSIENIDNCSAFAIYISSDYSCSLILGCDDYLNLKSIYKYSPVEVITLPIENTDIDIADSVYYISFATNDTSGILDVSKYFTNENIEVICGGVPGVDNAVRITLNDNYNDSNVEWLGCVYSGNGNIALLPKNLVFTYAHGLTGDLMDYINMARSKGRTEGYLYIRGLLYNTALTYNGATLYNSSYPSIGSGKCVHWTSSAVEFISTAPQSVYKWVTNDVPKCPTPSLYYISKHL